ncbi:MAG: CoA pyrophosphatase [Deltaproteobacteria bacterium]|jgi:8-oxo-dGTP pyrophosphatase MutT (NUDIX family)
MPSVSDLRLALSSHAPKTIPLEAHMRKAAVAAIFRKAERGVDLLLIVRAVHERDPWSGHMAFPGGRVEAHDPDPLAAAIRETKEEVDVDLVRSATHLGPLSHVLAKSHGKPVPLVIVPHVFLLDEPVTLTPDPSEVADTLYVPFDHLLDPANRDSMQRKYGGIPLTFACYRFGERILWGLTLQMIDELRGMFT